jgi:hypothetical protein
MRACQLPKDNVVAIRDERGRYLKDIPGGLGRPLESSNKLREDFSLTYTPLG